MEEKIDLRVFPSPDDAPCRFVWRCLCVLHNREHNRRHIGVLGASCEQTPGMASQYGGALRWNADIRRILVYSASTRNEVKTNSVAIQCVLGTSNRAYGSRYSGSHPVLRRGPGRRQLWRLGLPQNKRRASLGPSAMITKRAKCVDWLVVTPTKETHFTSTFHAAGSWVTSDL